jgi:hypothetical protein
MVIRRIICIILNIPVFLGVVYVVNYLCGASGFTGSITFRFAVMTLIYIAASFLILKFVKVWTWQMRVIVFFEYLALWPLLIYVVIYLVGDRTRV